VNRLLIILLIYVWCNSGYASDKEYYDYLINLNVPQSNALIQALSSDDQSMVLAAIQRIGDIRLTNAKKHIWNCMAQVNPEANQGKSIDDKQHEIMLKSIQTIGRIADDSDVRDIVVYLKAVNKSDHESLRAIYHSLGEIAGSTNAIQALNQLTMSVRDERDANELLSSILKQNSKTSASFLAIMSDVDSFSSGFKKLLKDSAMSLAKDGD
jgi:hypothetical protein